MSPSDWIAIAVLVVAIGTLLLGGYQTRLAYDTLRSGDKGLAKSRRQEHLSLLPRIHFIISAQVKMQNWLKTLRQAEDIMSRAISGQNPSLLPQLERLGLATPRGMVDKFMYENSPPWLSTLLITAARYHYTTACNFAAFSRFKDEENGFDATQSLLDRCRDSIFAIEETLGSGRPILQTHMSKIIAIPVITSLPKTIQEAGAFIWQHQDKLNAISHPGGVGTIEVGRGDREIVREVANDYRLALFSEINELQENFCWKHWSTEARDGRRWELLHPGLVAGEGTVQNVHLEVIDIVFFVVSFLQATGASEDDWSLVWHDRAWIYKLGNPADKADAKYLVEVALLIGWQLFEAQPAAHRRLCAMLIELCVAAGLTWEMTLSLYSQKLIKNYERQARGRQQVGDTLAQAENASVVA